MRSRAFTLIELVMVITVIGILSAVIFVNLNDTKDKEKIISGSKLSQSIHYGLSPNLIGDWNFNEGSGAVARDGSGFGSNATITEAVFSNNTPYSVIGGNSGKYSLSFDGINDYVSCGNRSILNVTGNYTLEAWIYPTRLTGYNTIMGKAKTTGSNTTLWLEHRDTGNIYFGGYTAAGAACYANIDNKIVANKWQYLVGTKTATQMKIYLNGEEIRSLNTACVPLTNDAVFSIGRRGEIGSYFQGLIDDVRVYNNVLSAFEIKQHYVEEAPKHDLTLK